MSAYPTHVFCIGAKAVIISVLLSRDPVLGGNNATDQEQKRNWRIRATLWTFVKAYPMSANIFYKPWIAIRTISRPCIGADTTQKPPCMDHGNFLGGVNGCK